MALSMSITVRDNFQKDITFENSYVTVDSISGKTDILVTVGFRDAKGGVLIQTKQYIVQVGLSEVNFIEQCYAYIKRLDEFKFASDC